VSDTIDKIIEKIPYFEGAFRRKVTSGAILLIVIYIMDIFDWADLGENNEPNLSFIFVMFLLVYATGNLIELISDVFVSSAIEFISKYRFFKPKKDRSVDIHDIFDKSGISFINSLPNVVKKSIENPYGKTRDTAWYYFSTIGEKFEVELARKLRAKNQDVLVITTSITVSILIFLFPFAIGYIEDTYGLFQQQQQQQEYAGAVGSVLQIMLVLLIVGIPLTFYKAYLISVKNSALVLVEYKVSKIQQEHNNSMQPAADTESD